MSLHVVRAKKNEPIYAVKWQGRLAELSEMPYFNQLACCVNEIKGGLMKANFGMGEESVPLGTYICYQEGRGFFVVSDFYFNHNYEEILIQPLGGKTEEAEFKDQLKEWNEAMK